MEVEITKRVVGLGKEQTRINIKDENEGNLENDCFNREYELTFPKAEDLTEKDRISAFASMLYRAIFLESGKLEYASKILSEWFQIDYEKLLSSISITPESLLYDTTRVNLVGYDYQAFVDNKKTILHISFIPKARDEVNCLGDILTKYSKIMNYCPKENIKNTRIYELIIANYSPNEDKTSNELPICRDENKQEQVPITNLIVYVPNIRKKMKEHGINSLTEAEKLTMLLVETDRNYVSQIANSNKLYQEYLEDSIAYSQDKYIKEKYKRELN